MRRLAALTAVLALAACFGRVSGWASLGAEGTHACCEASEKAPAPAISQCCPAGALSAARAPEPPARSALSSVPVALPSAPTFALASAPAVPAPLDGHAALAKARGPPLA